MTAQVVERDVQIGDEQNGDEQTGDVTVGAYRFHLLESGPAGAPSIVFLHGSGPGATAATNWQWLVGELGDTHHCIAPDIIGFGDSTHPDPPPLGLKAFTDLRVQTLLALLDELGIASAAFVGNSMGGIISLALTLAAPERVERLVLMGTGGAPIPPTPELVQLIRFYEHPTAEAMAALMSCFVHDPAFFEGKLDEIAAARMPRASRPDVERSHRATFAPGEPLGFTPEALATIAQPTIVVHGRNDRIMPFAAGEYMAEHLPNATLRAFDETGHWLQLERPQEFAELVRGFVDTGAR